MRCEVCTDDLRFTADETAALLRTVLGAELAPEDVLTLTRRTEGWAVGLQLAALRSNLTRLQMAFWLMSKVAQAPLMGFLGIPPGLEEQMTAGDRALVEQIERTLLTVSRQQDGLLNEAKNHENRQRARLEQISAPTLILTAAEDPFVTRPGAEYTAAHIPGAEHIRLEHGGHLLLGGLKSYWAQQGQFLQETRREAASARACAVYQML